MKPPLLPASVRIILLLTLGMLAGLCQSAPTGELVIPLIQFSEVSLIPAVENLARQAGLNYIFDPRISESSSDSVGKLLSRRQITLRLENLSAKEALLRVLKQNGLAMVDDPATTIMRITSTNWAAKPLVSPAQFAGKTNAVIPLIQFQDVPLEAALVQLGKTAGMSVVVDEKLTKVPTGYLTGTMLAPPLPTVSVRWQNLTAAQAFAALLENYDLAATKDETTSVCLVSRRESRKSKMPEGGDQKSGKVKN